MAASDLGSPNNEEQPETQSNACGEDTSSDKSYREQRRATSDSASTTLTL